MGETVDYKKVRDEIDARRLRALAKLGRRIKRDLKKRRRRRVEIDYEPGGTGPRMKVTGSVGEVTDSHVTLHDREPTAGAGPDFRLDHINSITYPE